MARNKKSSVQKEDKLVQNYFNQIEGAAVFNEEQLKVLREGYDYLKQLVVPGDYSEVAMILTTVMWSMKGNYSLDEVIKTALSEPFFERILSEVAPARIRELNEEDALLDKGDAIDQALESTLESLLDSEDIRIKIFLDVAVRGKTVEQVAKTNNISVQNVYLLYENAKETIKEKMIVEHDVLFKDEASEKTK